jgi:integrase
MRDVLYRWAFNKSRREAGPPAVDQQEALKWLESHTVRIPQMTDAALIRRALDTLALRMNGKAAAPTTIARKRAVFYGALKYAVELRLLPTNPLDTISWTTPKTNEEVDRRSVVNPAQARMLLAGVTKRAPRLTAFFACMYFSALRPEEVSHLREDDYERPEEKGGWGWFHLSGATVSSGEAWTDHAGTFEERGLKHRAATATRRVPIPPELVEILNDHISTFAVRPGDKLFRSAAGGPTHGTTYARIWRTVRQDVFTDAQRAGPLAKVPYQLRHAAVSLWLNAGVPAPQVAEWAGHSVHVLMKVYAKCLDDQEDAARHRIEAALAQPSEGHRAASRSRRSV